MSSASTAEVALSSGGAGALLGVKWASGISSVVGGIGDAVAFSGILASLEFSFSELEMDDFSCATGHVRRS